MDVGLKHPSVGTRALGTNSLMFLNSSASICTVGGVMRCTDEGRGYAMFIRAVRGVSCSVKFGASGCYSVRERSRKILSLVGKGGSLFSNSITI